MGVSRRGGGAEGEEVFLRKHNHQFVVLEIKKVNVSPGGELDISLGGEVRRGPSYPDPV